MCSFSLTPNNANANAFWKFAVNWRYFCISVLCIEIFGKILNANHSLDGYKNIHVLCFGEIFICFLEIARSIFGVLYGKLIAVDIIIKIASANHF